MLETLTLRVHATASARVLATRNPSLFSFADAQGFVRQLQRDPSPSRRTAAVRSLSLAYSAATQGAGDGVTALQAVSSETGRLAVPLSLAAPILYFLDRLVSLDLQSDDGLALLDAVVQQGGSGLAALERFSCTKVRWDRLVRLLAESRSLRDLKLGSLYLHVETAPPGDGAAEPDAPNPCLVDLASFGLACADQTFPSRLAYEDAVPVHAAPLPFPTFALRSLALHRFEGTDGTFVSLLNSCRSSLDVFSLTETTVVSRHALVAGLRLLGSLSELEITKCRFKAERWMVAPGIGMRNAPPVAGPLPSQPPQQRGYVLSPPAVPTALIFRPTAPAPPPPPPMRNGPEDSDSARVIHASLRLLEPDTPSRAALLNPVDRYELQYPLDSLARHCPFLHVLTLVDTDMVLSTHGIEQVLGGLPLERATIGFKRPHVPVEAVRLGMKASRGRLDAVTITVG